MSGRPGSHFTSMRYPRNPILLSCRLNITSGEVFLERFPLIEAAIAGELALSGGFTPISILLQLSRSRSNLNTHGERTGDGVQMISLKIAEPHTLIAGPEAKRSRIITTQGSVAGVT